MADNSPVMDDGATRPTMASSESIPLAQVQTASDPSSAPESTNPHPVATNSDAVVPDMETKALHSTSSAQSSSQVDPFSLSQYIRSDLDKKALRAQYPKAKPKDIKDFYERQNELIEAYLGSTGEEAAEKEDMGA
jgi:hypothetical protein